MPGPTAPPAPQHQRMRRNSGATGKPEQRFRGTPVSPGVAIGPVFGNQEPPTEVVHRTIAPAEAGAERERLRVAIAASIKQLNKLRARLSILPEDSQAEIAPLLAGDGKSLSADDRASMARRAEEVREIARRVVRNLTHTPFRSFAGLPAGAVLVCEWLRPSDAALLDPTRLAGVATDEGGGEGHTAVMLRALGMPAVLGADGLSHAIAEGDEVVVDGSAGVVILNPTPQTTAEARQAVAAFARERQRYARTRRLPAETTDGEKIELQANLGLPIELPLIAQSGARGVGLLRTEFLFMNREEVPDEDTQVEAMDGDTVTIRVLDWGGEKDIEALQAAGI